MPMSHKDMWRKIKRDTKGTSPGEEIRILEGFLADWPEYKGPYQEMRLKLERRIDKLRKIERVRAGSHHQHRDPFAIRKRGLAEVALVGLPNVGKSTVFQGLTGAGAEIADYPYTTLVPNIGMLSLGGLHFEIVDLPPFPDGSLDAVHYASGLKEAVQNADLLCLVVDLLGDHERQIGLLLDHLSGLDVEVSFARGGKGAMVIGTKRDLTPGRGVDALRDACPAALVFGWPGENTERSIGESLCRLLGKIVVYAKDPRSDDEPWAYALDEGATVLDLAAEIHADLARRARRARVSGPSAKYGGQEVGLDHVLDSGDTVEVFTR